MTQLLACLLVGWFALNFLGAASRQRDTASRVFSAFIYLGLALAVLYITRH